MGVWAAVQQTNRRLNNAVMALAGYFLMARTRRMAMMAAIGAASMARMDSGPSPTMRLP